MAASDYDFSDGSNWEEEEQIREEFVDTYDNEDIEELE